MWFSWLNQSLVKAVSMVRRIWPGSLHHCACCSTRDKWPLRLMHLWSLDSPSSLFKQWLLISVHLSSSSPARPLPTCAPYSSSSSSSLFPLSSIFWLVSSNHLSFLSSSLSTSPSLPSHCSLQREYFMAVEISSPSSHHPLSTLPNPSVCLLLFCLSAQKQPFVCSLSLS